MVFGLTRHGEGALPQRGRTETRRVEEEEENEEEDEKRQARAESGARGYRAKIGVERRGTGRVGSSLYLAPALAQILA